MGYLHQQLIIVDFSWIRKRRGVHDDPRESEICFSFVGQAEMTTYIGRVLHGAG